MDISDGAEMTEPRRPVKRLVVVRPVCQLSTGVSRAPRRQSPCGHPRACDGGQSTATGVRGQSLLLIRNNHILIVHLHRRPSRQHVRKCFVKLRAPSHFATRLNLRASVGVPDSSRSRSIVSISIRPNNSAKATTPVPVQTKAGVLA